MLVISPSKWPENILLCWLIAPEALTEFPPTVANLITSPTVQAINKVLTQCASNAEMELNKVLTRRASISCLEFQKVYKLLYRDVVMAYVYTPASGLD